MEQKNLNTHNIFAISLKNSLPDLGENHFILYSPLARKAFLSNEKEISAYELWLKEKGDNCPYSRLNQALDYQPVEKQIFAPYQPETIHKLSVLPTHSCNMSCSYCYSAHGRSGAVLSKQKLTAALDYFIDHKRPVQKDLHLCVIGGGEPLLEWPLVRYCFEYAGELSQKEGFSLIKTLITNGSILSNEIIDFLKSHDILPNISFDIMEKHQNRQRGNFSKISGHIKQLLKAGLQPTLNATITPVNVDDLLEMVKFVNAEYNGVNNLIFEPVVSRSFFQNPKEFDDFHKKFTQNFFAARSLALSMGIELRCKAFINMFNLTRHGCETRFSLSPEGFITNCYCVSSPQEKQFNDRVIGQITPQNKIAFDRKNYNTILRKSVDKKEKCRDCFLKFNCGGGCMLTTEVYNDEFFDVLCKNMREFSIKALLEKYNLLETGISH